MHGGRGPDLAALLLTPAEREDDDEGDVDGGPRRGMLLLLPASSAVKERGMLQFDVYREWDFTGPDGETIDVGQVVADALPPGENVEGLYASLRG